MPGDFYPEIARRLCFFGKFPRICGVLEDRMIFRIFLVFGESGNFRFNSGKLCGVCVTGNFELCFW